jgi:hypothetical protein
MLGGRVSMRPTFGGVLNGEEPFFLRNEGRERVQHRRFAGAGAAGNDESDARLHSGREQFRHLRPQRTDLDQLVQIERLLGKFADRHQWPVDRHRTHRDVDARAVKQPGVAHRMRFIDATANRRDDLVDDAKQMRLVLETHAGRFEDAGPLDVNALMAVDQDVVDGRVLEQRLKRPKAGHLIENLQYEIVEFLSVESEPLGQDVLRHQLLNVTADFLFGKLFQRRQIDLLDEPAVQPHLGVKELVGEQRI